MQQLHRCAELAHLKAYPLRGTQPYEHKISNSILIIISKAAAQSLAIVVTIASLPAHENQIPSCNSHGIHRNRTRRVAILAVLR